MVHVVTALRAQKRNPNRINVYLDGEFSFGLSRIVAAWLSVGQAISDEKILTLKNEDELEVAYQQALKFISYRSRSSSEIEKFLSDKGTNQDTIHQTINRMERSGIVDDNRFAQDWTDNRSTFRPRSRRAVRQELRRKGISDEVIELTLNDMLPEEELAYHAGVTYSRKLTESDRFEFFRRLGGFLARRGFTYDVIKPVVTRIWEEKASSHSKVIDNNAIEQDNETR